MPLNNVGQGFHNTPSYQSSGLPWVTSSTVTGIAQLEFDFVTRWIIIQNRSSGTLLFAFTRNGLTTSSHFFTVPANTSTERLELRVKRMFLSGTAAAFDVVAGLTTIPPRELDDLTGSSGLPGIG